ncbi:glutathione transferase GstA [Pelagibius marinus]|uniref:glutathione transferase GstA n=1 Tax=Pelagibius marinus TaxID=2762760 RepID=UPI0018728CB9|nr:glutathione transferase GstA [Pelagibius marinus]
MKLYYLPGSCSLASHIALREVGADFDLERIDAANKSADFLSLNPKGYVPALTLDDGDLLTENAAILQFIADSKPSAALAPAAGSRERTHLQAYLNFVATELHKAFSPLFKADSGEAEKEAARKKVHQKFDYVNDLLSDGRQYLMGDSFSVADIYLFVVANWTGPTGIGLDSWPNIAAFQQRVAGRDAVQAALKAEGLAA